MAYLFSLFLFLARGGATLHFKLTSVLRILPLGYGIRSVVGAPEECWVYPRCFSSLAERSKTDNGLKPRSDMLLEKLKLFSRCIFFFVKNLCRRGIQIERTVRKYTTPSTGVSVSAVACDAIRFRCQNVGLPNCDRANPKKQK